MSVLAPCPGCDRHVRLPSDACPFCGTSLAGRPAPARPVLPARLGRAAMMTFGAAAVAGSLAVSGCGSRGDGGGPGPVDSGMADDATMGGGDAAYGAPPDTGLPAPAYGAPQDAGPMSDQDAGGGDVPLYGAPP